MVTNFNIVTSLSRLSLISQLYCLKIIVNLVLVDLLLKLIKVCEGLSWNKFIKVLWSESSGV